MSDAVTNNLSGLIQSVAVLIGALLPIAVAILAFIKTHTNSKNIQKTVNTAQGMVNSLAETDKWVLSHQEGLTNLVGALSANPEIRKAMEEHNMDITKMKIDLDKSTSEIKSLYDAPSSVSTTDSDPVDSKLKEIDQRTKVTRT